MAVKDWYSWKIGLIWVLPVLFLFLLLRTNIETSENTIYTLVGLWALTTAIAWSVTWKWLRSRDERGSK